MWHRRTLLLIVLLLGPLKQDFDALLVLVRTVYFKSKELRSNLSLLLLCLLFGSSASKISDRSYSAEDALT